MVDFLQFDDAVPAPMILRLHGGWVVAVSVWPDGVIPCHPEALVPRDGPYKGRWVLLRVLRSPPPSAA